MGMAPEALLLGAARSNCAGTPPKSSLQRDPDYAAPAREPKEPPRSRGNARTRRRERPKKETGALALALSSFVS